MRQHVIGFDKLVEKLPARSADTFRVITFHLFTKGVTDVFGAFAARNSEAQIIVFAQHS
jgi:hypothetical protein